MTGQELYEDWLQDYLPVIFWTVWESTTPEIRDACEKMAEALKAVGVR